MKKTTITRTIIQYSKKCGKCGKWIKGGSESQVLYNLKIHKIAKHSNNKKRVGMSSMGCDVSKYTQEMKGGIKKDE